MCTALDQTTGYTIPLYEPSVGTSGKGCWSSGMSTSSSPSLFSLQPLSSSILNIFKQAALYTPCKYHYQILGHLASQKQPDLLVSLAYQRCRVKTHRDGRTNLHSYVQTCRLSYALTCLCSAMLYSTYAKVAPCRSFCSLKLAPSSLTLSLYSSISLVLQSFNISFKPALQICIDII